jgi:hypothetical protein
MSYMSELDIHNQERQERQEQQQEDCKHCEHPNSGIISYTQVGDDDFIVHVCQHPCLAMDTEEQAMEQLITTREDK